MDHRVLELYDGYVTRGADKALAAITAQDARGWFRLAGYAPAD